MCRRQDETTREIGALPFAFGSDDEAPSEAPSQCLEELTRKIRDKLTREKQEKEQLAEEIRQLRAQMAQLQAAERAEREGRGIADANALRLQQELEAAERTRLLGEAEKRTAREAEHTQQVQRELELERRAHAEAEQARVRAEQAQAAMATQVERMNTTLQQFRLETQQNTQQLREQVQQGQQDMQQLRSQFKVNTDNVELLKKHVHCTGFVEGPVPVITSRPLEGSKYPMGPMGPMEIPLFQ